MLQYTSGPVGIKKQDWAEKKKPLKPKVKCFSILPLIKHRNKDGNNDSYFHKIYFGEELEHYFLFLITKLFTILTMKQNQSFSYQNIFPAAQHDNTVLNSNGTTDHCYKVCTTQYALQIFKKCYMKFISVP